MAVGDHKYEFNVQMACSGCSGAVNRALSKLNGVSNVDISLKDQLVKVDATSASYEDVEAAIKKTGKVIKSGKVVQPAETDAKPAATPSTVAENKPIDQATKITAP